MFEGSTGSGLDNYDPPYSGNCTEDVSVFEPYHSFTTSIDSAEIVLKRGFLDINELNRLTALATDKRNTYLVMTSDAIMDMNNNNLWKSLLTMLRLHLNISKMTVDPS